MELNPQFLNFATFKKGSEASMYKEYKQLDLPAIGKEILAFWKSNQIFEKSISNRPDSKPYTFYEGPPSANGMPGIHHVMARAIKDIFCRYKTLKGYQVKRKGGWDTHGLPIELAVEKTLGITKEDIGKKISVEDYNSACRKEVMKYTDVWNDRRSGDFWRRIFNCSLQPDQESRSSVNFRGSCCRTGTCRTRQR